MSCWDNIFQEYCKRDRYLKMYGGSGNCKSYINNLKGKKMESVFQVTVVRRDSETGKLIILVPITTVLATGTEDAKTKTLITFAKDCKTTEGIIQGGIDVLVRPFC